jgi:hypothetical protein
MQNLKSPETKKILKQKMSQKNANFEIPRIKTQDSMFPKPNE